MTGPVSEHVTGVYFDFIGLDTVIVCIAPHSGLFEQRRAMLLKEVAPLIVRTSAKKIKETFCQVLFPCWAQRTNLQKAGSEYQLNCSGNEVGHRTLFIKLELNQSQIFFDIGPSLPNLLWENLYKYINNKNEYFSFVFFFFIFFL